MSQTFPIAPGGGSGGLMILAFVVVLMLVVTAAVGRAVLAGTTATFEVTPAGLTLRGDWWGRTVPRDALRVDEARIVDLEAEPELRPTSRWLGTALPGYQGGWFHLANGEDGLLYVTDRRRVVVVPTMLGYTILLSPQDPEGLLSALRR